MNEDIAKLNKYKEHIRNLEKLFESVEMRGEFEQYRLAPCFMLFNFIDLLRSVAILDNNHMIVAGSIVIRSMFEILIDFLYCETNRNELYLRFGEYENVNRVKLYSLCPDKIKSGVDSEVYNRCTFPKYEEFKKKYNINTDKQLYSWSGVSLSTKVKIVSKTIPEVSFLYLDIYKVNCRYAHTFSTTICEYSTILDGKLHMDYEKQYNKDKYILIREINSLVDIFYNTFKSNYANRNLADMIF